MIGPIEPAEAREREARVEVLAVGLLEAVDARAVSSAKLRTTRTPARLAWSTSLSLPSDVLVRARAREEAAREARA